MANIVIGSFTPAREPSDRPMIRPGKSAAAVETYSSVAYLSWGVSIVGEVIEIGWDYLSASDFDSLDAIYVTDAPVVFNPNDGSGKTYNVNIMSLDGKYHIGVDDAFLRKEVKLTLLIMSEVA